MTSLAKKFSKASRPSRMEEQHQNSVAEEEEMVVDAEDEVGVKNKEQEDEGIGSDDSPTASSTTSGDSDRESKVRKAVWLAQK